MRPGHPIVVATFVSTLLLVACGSDVSPPQVSGPALEFVLASEGGTVASAPITVTLTNQSVGPITVVRPFVSPNFVRFTVTDAEGGQMLFIGALMKLVPLEDDYFATLAPSESVSSDFDLAALFELAAGTVSVTAEYRNPPDGSHEGGRAFTASAGEGIDAGAITIEVSP